MKIDDLTVLNDLRERLAQITDEQIEATNRKLSPISGKKEKIAGSVDSQTTRALYALVYALSAEEMIHTAQAHAEVNEVSEEDHKHRAAFLDMLGDVARELFWAQAKVDAGFHKKASVGIRKGWILVEDNRPTGPRGFMASLMGSMPPGLMPPDDDD